MRRGYVPASHPLFDSWIYLNNCKLREEKKAQEEYEKLCLIFKDEINAMHKKTPLEFKERAELRTFMCEIKQFSSQNEKTQYLNSPHMYPIHLCDPVFKHTSKTFFKKLFCDYDKIRELVQTKKRKEHIDDQLTWNENSVFEVTLFHGSKKFTYYFDEEFFMKQLINWLIVLHRFNLPNKKIMDAFNISQNEESKTLRIRI